jgi:CHAD domain-containing protein
VWWPSSTAPRYLRLLDALDALVAAPPFIDRASGRAADVLPPLVLATWKRLDKALRTAEKAPGEQRDLLAHEARKDAKAARYAAEAVVPVFGAKAKRFAAAMADLQEALGEHQDGVVVRELLRELGAGANRSGENGFTFGRLHALEQARADAVVARWPEVRQAVSTPKLRRWLE